MIIGTIVYMNGCEGISKEKSLFNSLSKISYDIAKVLDTFPTNYNEAFF